MNAVLDSWTRAARLVWAGLPRLLLLGLLWILTAWPIVTAGPATLAAYRWVALYTREEREGNPLEFFRHLIELFWPGLAWGAGIAATIALFWANLRYWTDALPPLPAAAVVAFWLYLLVFVAAMQPHLLERIAVERRPWREAFPAAALAVVLNPLYAHAQLALPVVAMWIGSLLSAIVPLALASATLVFLAVSAADLPLRPEAARPPRRDGSRD